jgi:hypothetical protein
MVPAHPGLCCAVAHTLGVTRKAAVYAILYQHQVSILQQRQTAAAAAAAAVNACKHIATDAAVIQLHQASRMIQ